jgi:hypothetical protein
MVERSGVAIGTYEFLTIDVQLEIGAMSDYVSVVAEPLLMEISTASNGQTLRADVLDALPNAGSKTKAPRARRGA